MFLRKIVFICLLILFATACGDSEAAAGQTPAPTPTTMPVATVPGQGDAATVEGPVAEATVTPAPTTTPTPASSPTPTVTPTAEATVTPTAEPTPTPVALFSAEDFGDNRNPLTGELVEDPAVLQRRPLAVKISNAPAVHVRPQSGLSQADLVFEHPTEGPITRFTAVFYGQAPPDVGPIRSARLIDLEIPAMYDAGFAYSGASIGVSQHLSSSDIRPRLIRSSEPGYYRTGADKPWEHTLYGDPAGFWQALDIREQNRPPTFATFMAFSSEPPDGGEPASEVTVTYRNFTTVNWRYDTENGRYWRWADGEAAVDANNGEQLSAANVVVVFAIHQLDMSICEHQVGNVCHAFSTQIQLWNRGAALVFRNGRSYETTWRRERRSDMLTFYDGEGNPLPLQVGNTWFQVVPLHYVDPVTVTP